MEKQWQEFRTPRPSRARVAAADSGVVGVRAGFGRTESAAGSPTGNVVPESAAEGALHWRRLHRSPPRRALHGVVRPELLPSAARVTFFRPGPQGSV